VLRLVGIRRHGLALDLEVRRGELVALVGPSGAGKTTALRILAGLDQPDAGLVVAPPARDIALVAPAASLYAHLTVFENLAFPLRRRLAADHEIAARVGAVARDLGITPLLARAPASLSGGERQRVALACAAVRAPRVLLVDDPRADLVDELVRVHRAAGATTIVAGTEAIAAADRVVVLALEDPGQLAARHGDPSHSLAR
jgi:multiple sugar transport system ATP-binding protein